MYKYKYTLRTLHMYYKYMYYIYQLNWKYHLTALKPVYKEAFKPVNGSLGDHLGNHN